MNAEHTPVAVACEPSLSLRSCPEPAQPSLNTVYVIIILVHLPVFVGYLFAFVTRIGHLVALLKVVSDTHPLLRRCISFCCGALRNPRRRTDGNADDGIVCCSLRLTQALRLQILCLSAVGIILHLILISEAEVPELIMRLINSVYIFGVAVCMLQLVHYWAGLSFIITSSRNNVCRRMQRSVEIIRRLLFVTQFTLDFVSMSSVDSEELVTRLQFFFWVIASCFIFISVYLMGSQLALQNEALVERSAFRTRLICVSPACLRMCTQQVASCAWFRTQRTPVQFSAGFSQRYSQRDWNSQSLPSIAEGKAAAEGNTEDDREQSSSIVENSSRLVTDSQSRKHDTDETNDDSDDTDGLPTKSHGLLSLADYSSATNLGDSFCDTKDTSDKRSRRSSTAHAYSVYSKMDVETNQTPSAFRGVRVLPDANGSVRGGTNAHSTHHVSVFSVGGNSRETAAAQSYFNTFATKLRIVYRVNALTWLACCASYGVLLALYATSQSASIWCCTHAVVYTSAASLGYSVAVLINKPSQTLEWFMQQCCCCTFKSTPMLQRQVTRRRRLSMLD